MDEQPDGLGQQNGPVVALRRSGGFHRGNIPWFGFIWLGQHDEGDRKKRRLNPEHGGKRPATAHPAGPFAGKKTSPATACAGCHRVPRGEAGDAGRVPGKEARPTAE